jgi:hypothetical protein
VPEYRDDVLKAIADLERNVGQLAAAAQKRGALTTASQGWVIPNRSTPSTPSSGAHLYASGGQLMVRQANGTSFPIEPAPEVEPFVKANNVTNPASFAGGTAPGSYSQSLTQQLLDAVAELNSKLIALLNSLRTSGGTGDGIIG